jgi:bifunctional DNA-binding transcriptional regulator/antitoxin component of YhaV-PrlF toxin-antitoxin module
MLTELSERSQITLPGFIVEKMGLRAGDKLSVSEQDGAIRLTPLAGDHTSESCQAWPEGFAHLSGAISDDTFIEPGEISFSERESM